MRVAVYPLGLIALVVALAGCSARENLGHGKSEASSRPLLVCRDGSECGFARARARNWVMGNCQGPMLQLTDGLIQSSPPVFGSVVPGCTVAFSEAGRRTTEISIAFSCAGQAGCYSSIPRHTLRFNSELDELLSGLRKLRLR